MQNAGPDAGIGADCGTGPQQGSQPQRQTGTGSEYQYPPSGLLNPQSGPVPGNYTGAGFVGGGAGWGYGWGWGATAWAGGGVVGPGAAVNAGIQLAGQAGNQAGNVPNDPGTTSCPTTPPPSPPTPPAPGNGCNMWIADTNALQGENGQTYKGRLAEVQPKGAPALGECFTCITYDRTNKVFVYSPLNSNDMYYRNASDGCNPSILALANQ